MTWSWLPSTTDVGAILRARTVDRNGVELGDFATTTRPTAVEVTNLIVQASRDVEAKLGSAPAATQTQEIGKHLVAIKAAMLIEISYWPEQVGTGRSPYEQLRKMYEDELMRALNFEATDGDEDGANDGSALTVHSFPICDPGFIGLNTPW